MLWHHINLAPILPAIAPIPTACATTDMITAAVAMIVNALAVKCAPTEAMVTDNPALVAT